MSHENELQEAIERIYPLAEHYHKARSFKSMNEPNLNTLAAICKNLGWETLNKSCGACIGRALDLLYTYRNERKEVFKDLATIKVKKATKVEVNPEPQQEDNLQEEFLNSKSLAELREMFPKVKSNSKAKFIEKALKRY